MTQSRLIILFAAILIGLFTLQCCNGGNSSSTTKVDPPKSADAKSADTIQVPAPVMNRFIFLFPTVNKVEWEMEENDYEATFQYNQGEKSVLFTPEGEAISSETEINTNSLPEAMTAYISEHLNGKKIEKAEMVATVAGSITYEVEVEGEDYIFDGAGKFLKIEEKEGDEKGK